MEEWIMLNPISTILGIILFFVFAFVISEIMSAEFEDEFGPDSEDENPNS